jgi:hypothetical protein
MKRILISALAIGAVLAGTSQAQAASLTTLRLDDFDTADQNIDFSGYKVVPDSTFPVKEHWEAATGSGILGSQRELYFRVNQNKNKNSASAKIGWGDFNLSQGSGVSTFFTLKWDGLGTDEGAVGLNQDFSAFDRLALNIKTIDLTANLALAMTDSSGNTAWQSQNGLSAGIANFNFADFNGFSNFDLANVKSVSLYLSSEKATDLQLDFIEARSAVPEPFTMLGSVAAVGFGAAFRRKYKKKA